MRMRSPVSRTAWLFALCGALASFAAHAVPSQTRISISDGRWHINDEVTYRGARAEGLLLNVRMVNATFEDRNHPDFNPDANTDKFVAQIPDYVAHGVRAFTLNL